MTIFLGQETLNIDNYEKGINYYTYILPVIYVLATIKYQFICEMGES